MWRIAACWLAEALRGRRGLHALDVGCGTGMGAVRLAERPEIEQVVGLDPSPPALAEARRRHGFPLVRGSALALPFAAGRFDVVTCFDVLQHLPDGRLHQAAGELRRVLRPDGIAVLRSNTRARRFADSINWGSSSRRRASRCGARATPTACPRLRRSCGRGSRAPDRSGHPAGGGLQIRLPHPWVNRVMGGIAAAEAFVAGRLPARLPFGHSTMLLVQVQAVRS